MPTRVERHLVDFEDRALRVEQADELDHRVQRDARQFLAILLAAVAGKKLGAANRKQRIGHERLGGHRREPLAPGGGATWVELPKASLKSCANKRFWLMSRKVGLKKQGDIG